MPASELKFFKIALSQKFESKMKIAHLFNGEK